MDKSELELLAVDVVLLIIAFLVFQNLQWQSSFAGSPHGHTQGYSASYSYGLFTQVLSMSGGPLTLSSPLTIDWLQVIGAILAVLNAWYAYAYLSRKKIGLRASKSRPPSS